MLFFIALCCGYRLIVLPYVTLLWTVFRPRAVQVLFPASKQNPCKSSVYKGFCVPKIGFVCNFVCNSLFSVPKKVKMSGLSALVNDRLQAVSGGLPHVRRHVGVYPQGKAGVKMTE